jgi:acyl-CoA reductase-like NAD-dependent aldehyde dehydrogenase
VKPTVFVNVRNDMAIAREEIFGPVLCVIAYENDEDAIRIANDSRYVFTPPSSGRTSHAHGASPPSCERDGW